MKSCKLHLDKVGATLSKLSNEQADYIGVPVQGPFKSDNYRYDYEIVIRNND